MQSAPALRIQVSGQLFLGSYDLWFRHFFTIFQIFNHLKDGVIVSTGSEAVNLRGTQSYRIRNQIARLKVCQATFEGWRLIQYNVSNHSQYLERN